jgi:hypothetical protein
MLVRLGLSNYSRIRFNADAGGAGGGGGDGAGGDPAGGAQAITADNPEVKKLIEAGVASATESLKGHNARLLDDVAKLKPLRDQFEKLGGEDGVAQLLELRDKLNKDDAAKLLAEGKTEEWLERQTEAMRREHDNQLKGRDAKLEEKDETIAALSEKLTQLTIDSSIRQAGTKLELVGPAMDDAVLLARNVFTLDDGGNPVAKNDDGTVKLGKDGKTALSPSEWLEGMKDTRPHWFPATGGMGTQRTGGRPGGMTDAQFSALPPAERIALARKEGGGKG